MVTWDVTGAPKGMENYACYATSVDGVNREKPFLGLDDYSALTWRGTPIGKEQHHPQRTRVAAGPIYKLSAFWFGG